MNVLKTIYDLLSTDSGVTALVSTRVYPGVVPQAIDQPYVMFLITDDQPQDDKNGSSSLDVYIIDVRCYSHTPINSVDINNAVRETLDRFSGANEGNVIDKIIYQGCDGPYFDEPTGMFRTDADYRARVKVAFGTATPTVDVLFNVYVNSVLNQTFTANVLQTVTINIEP